MCSQRRDSLHRRTEWKKKDDVEKTRRISSGLFSSGGRSVRFLTRYDGEVSEPLVEIGRAHV